jgi:hypothetical protein
MTTADHGTHLEEPAPQQPFDAVADPTDYPRVGRLDLAARLLAHARADARRRPAGAMGRIPLRASTEGEDRAVLQLGLVWHRLADDLGWHRPATVTESEDAPPDGRLPESPTPSVLHRRTEAAAGTRTIPADPRRAVGEVWSAIAGPSLAAHVTATGFDAASGTLTLTASSPDYAALLASAEQAVVDRINRAAPGGPLVAHLDIDADLHRQPG